MSGYMQLHVVTALPVYLHKYLNKLDYSLVNFQYNGNQRKDKENMPSKEFDNILFDFYIPLVGKQISGEI